MAYIADRKILIECGNCHTKFQGTICGEHHFTDGDGEPTGICIGMIVCISCDRPIVFEQHTEYDFDNNIEFDSPKIIYPMSSFNFNSTAPEPISNALEEAVICFKAKAYTASAIMCRKVLEGNLSDKLKTMKTQEIIDKRLFDWSDALRLAGNDAVHNVNVRIDKNDAQDIVDFANAITDYLFSFRQKFDEFQRRRKERAKTVDET